MFSSPPTDSGSIATRYLHQHSFLLVSLGRGQLSPQLSSLVLWAREMANQNVSKNGGRTPAFPGVVTHTQKKIHFFCHKIRPARQNMYEGIVPLCLVGGLYVLFRLPIAAHAARHSVQVPSATWHRRAPWTQGTRSFPQHRP